MPNYSGDVTLPDGRQFHGVVKMSAVEWDTNASNMLSVEIYNMDGEETPVDVQNEEIEWPGSYDGKTYLWSAVVDMLLETPPQEDDYGYD